MRYRAVFAKIHLQKLWYATTIGQASRTLIGKRMRKFLPTIFLLLVSCIMSDEQWPADFTRAQGVHRFDVNEFLGQRNRQPLAKYTALV